MTSLPRSHAGTIVAVNIGPGGVPKHPVERAWVASLGLEGDRHREPEPIHGGPDGAVCLYASEAIRRVAAEGHTAFPGAFGENLTTLGIGIGLLAPGTRLAVGTGGLVLEITKPAAPCVTLQHYFTDGRFARVSHKVHPEDARQYARVLVEGPVVVGDAVEVLDPATDSPAAAMDSPAAAMDSPAAGTDSPAAPGVTA